MISPLASPTYGAAEVETELEDNVDNDLSERLAGAAEEIEDEAEFNEEEEEDDYDPHDDAGHDAGSMSSTPSSNRPVEVWKQFGCETEAGRALRKLYGNLGQSKAAARISYPKLTAQRKPEPIAAPKACPQRARVSVPKPGQRPSLDPDDPRNWRMPVGGRKPGQQILEEMQAAKPEKPNLVEGRDHAAEKSRLQDKFRYCGSNAMPKGAMGYVPKGEMPKALPRQQERLDSYDEAAGMTVEQRQILEELVQAMQRKQQRLKEIDAENAAEEGKLSKVRTVRNKEALQLQNDIQGLTADIDLLLKLAEA
mmetsp:Transcript_7835/g.18259  ORF Transcript_7835/g.18259 Transcript_7835/m.18259 type:complete len:309 (+) Transcript_7835:61-987(+)